MKTRLLAVLNVLALAGTFNAQSINVTPTGVGIGTATPAQKLDVVGNVAVSGNITATGSLCLGNTAPQGKFEIFNYLEPSATPLMSIRTRFDGVGKYAMIRFGEAAATTHQKGAIIYESTTSVGRGRIHLALENTDGAGSVALSDAKLTVLSNGNVGVGTTTPGMKLEVANGGAAYNAYLSGTAPSLYFGPTPGVFPNSPAVSAAGFVSFSTFDGAYSSGTGDMNIATQSRGTGNTSAINFLVPFDDVGNYTRAMRIMRTGNVGIGVNSPTHKLSVNGEVKSRGFITDTSAWADYVFAPDYKLPTLNEVEAHIKAHQHLPGIPSEKEAVANGINLGEMQVRLLAQVEQLTLHMIALNKQVESQQEEIQSLRAASVNAGSFGKSGLK